MTELEQAAFSALKACNFFPGTSQKKFINQLTRETVMTDKQRAWFWVIFIQFRRQHKRLALLEYAQQQVAKDKLEKFEDKQ